MAKRALLEPRRPHVVNGRRRIAERAVRGRVRPGKVGVALQADEADLRARQHAWVGGPVRLMAGGAGLGFDRRVLEDERAAFVAMTLEAGRLVGIDGAEHAAGARAAMGI